MLHVMKLQSGVVVLAKLFEDGPECEQNFGVIGGRHSSFNFNEFLDYERSSLFKTVPTMVIIDHLFSLYRLYLIFIF